MSESQTPNHESATRIDASAPKKKDRTPLIVGAVVVLLVIAAAVVFFVTQSQVNQQTAPSFSRLGGGGQGLNGQFGGPGGFRNFQMTSAPELPTAQADLNGFVVRVDGQSIFVGQRFGRGFRPDVTPDPSQPTSTPVPDVEVLVTSDTVIYKDTTPRPDFQNGQPPSGPVTIQQQVTVSSLAELPANSRVTVWGDRTGNQLAAKVIVYTQFAPRQPQSNGGNPSG